MIQFDEDLNTWYLVWEGELYYLDATTQHEAYAEAAQMMNQEA